MTSGDGLRLALAVVSAFTLSGMVQTAWLHSRAFRRFAWPLDLGLEIGGRRLLGDNKTFAGVVVMLPATALAFAVVGALLEVLDPALPGRTGWPAGTRDWLSLGLAAGLGYSAAELPNSALKRRFDVPPGGRPEGKALAAVTFLADQLDSVAGVWIALWMLVPVGLWFTLFWLALAPLVHWLFNLLLYLTGRKARPA